MDEISAVKRVIRQEPQSPTDGVRSAEMVSSVAASSAIKGSEYGGPSVFLRSFAVLNYIVCAGRPVLATDIAAHLGLPRPTVYRMIEQLETEGFLRRQLASRHVVIGSRLTDFGAEILKSSVQYAPRRQIMNKLVDEVGETCNLGALDGNEIVYFDRVEATHWPLRLHFHVGSKVPLHCTAIGKLFLAFLPKAMSRTLIDQLELRPFTSGTITTISTLEGEIGTIRRDGLSVDREEYLVGVVCLAAPIFNAKQEITAGIAIQAPAARTPIANAYRHRTALLHAAKALSESLMFPD